ncbi:MAG: hypothetical protein J0G32_03690 [Alphaproteobacteria bacterium]|nr:hypothetical protein [Alphaproteobacteria bacterium]OJV16048.1 MAG: hypothetical protein BGO27_04295 [Alphaproteobacteria bacterium 33-17]
MTAFLSIIENAYNNYGKLYIDSSGNLAVEQVSKWWPVSYSSSEKEAINKFMHDHINDLNNEGIEYFQTGKSLSKAQEYLDYYTSKGVLSEKIDVYSNVYSNWMKYLPDELKQQAFSHLLLPGTHDSASVKIDWAHPIEHENTSWLANLSKTLNYMPGINNLVENWTATQSESITDQLKHGVRAFDLRVAYNKADGQIYLTHTFTVDKLDKVLEEFKTFIDQHPDEVVKIHIKPDWEHRKDTYPHIPDINKLINQNFGSKLFDLYDYGKRQFKSLDDVTIKELQAKHKNIILTYDKSYEKMHGNQIQEDGKWHNVNSVEEQLKAIHNDLDHLNEETTKSESLSVTPDASTVFHYRSLESMARDINSHLYEILDHYKHAHKDGHYLNEIDLDYATPELIESIIQANLSKDFLHD